MQISFPHPRRLPTDDEVEHCTFVAEYLDAEIDKIKLEISRLQKQIDVLKEKRLNHLSFISPIRCLPPELISEICLASVKVGISPLILNQICGRFREIVNSTSELWSRIHLTEVGNATYRSRRGSIFPEVNICYKKT
jgi:hypothetical protein